MANTELARQRHDTRDIKAPCVPKGSMANLPRDMHIRPGLKLQACVKEREEHIINGLEYEVLAIDDSIVRLRKLDPSGFHRAEGPDTDKHGAPFELPHKETALKMRLQHALCDHTAQGRPLHDGVVVCTDTSHPAFSRRHLITGIGRVGDTSSMEVM